ncbi:MAG: hypothetical protein ACTS5A_00075 [Candidatus Hodgkinia cicadicola]
MRYCFKRRTFKIDINLHRLMKSAKFKVNRNLNKYKLRFRGKFNATELWKQFS